MILIGACERGHVDLKRNRVFLLQSSLPSVLARCSLNQTFAQDAEIAATAATQRNASLERELLALKDDTDTAAAEQLKKLEELTSALKEAQEAVTAAEEQAREASQKQAEAEDAAQKAIAAEAAKEEAAQFKVCVLTLNSLRWALYTIN
jgi:chromosome segregation ATPase